MFRSCPSASQPKPAEYIPEAAKRIVKHYKLDSIPVGQSGKKSSRFKIMSGFKTRGTPWTIIIAPDGTVKFNDFHIKPTAAKKLITSLRKDAK